MAHTPKCPVRYGEPCTACQPGTSGPNDCQPGTSGPNDCQLVQLVREDPELKQLMVEMINKARLGKHGDQC
ncbi:DUF6767 domain-containing protein [Corynebacterium diphtheriae]|uniref:DUF6767 domain-containing protein n=1 Tax=Corynebacterium diphtheriae TaxID=1717 RepID=UPI004042F8A7